MKPILVNNQQEWERLKEFIKNNGTHAIVGIENKQRPTFISVYQNGIAFASYDSAKNAINYQTVDEYLALQKPTNAKSETVETWDVNDFPAVPPKPVNSYKIACCQPERMMELLDKEAKLEAQTKAINEAIEEIEAKAARHESVGDYLDRYAAQAIREVREIITSKLASLK